MTRSIHRRSMTSRLLCAYVVLVVLVSFAGVGYAVPGSSNDSTSLASSESTAGVPPATEDPVVVPPEDEVVTPDEEAPAPEDDAAAEEPAAEEPALEPAAEEPAEELAAEEAATLAKASPLNAESFSVETAEAVEPITDPTTATAQGVVPTYVDGNPVCEDYFGFKIDGVPENKTYTGLPGGATITISNSSNGQFDFSASGVLIHGVIVKAANGAYIYCYDPDGITADQGLYSVLTNKGGFFGISHVIFCYTQTPSTGNIIVRKYYDEDDSGYHEGGEDWLAGFSFKLESGESSTGPWTEVDTLTTEGPNGWVTFDNQIAGWYRITEMLTQQQIDDGWVCTRSPVRIFYHTGEENGQVFDQEYKWFGNRQVREYTKTFELTYKGDVPANTTFHVHYKVDGVDHYLDLAGTSSPFTASEDLLEGVEITDVTWDAEWTPDGGAPVHIRLGTSDDDPRLCKDLTNSFTYEGEIDGHKYEDMNADGSKSGDDGLEGWKIYLERKVGDTWVLYPAFDVTDANGYYQITGILPGTYRVYEDIDAQTPPDWTCSYPSAGYHQTTLDAGGASEVTVACHHKRTLNFLNWAPATIRGTKYNDLNADGVHDLGEPGLEGWRIFVDYNENGELDLATDTEPFGPEPYDDTDDLGNYEITGVHPGTYWVLEEMLPGWFQSDPGGDDYGHLVTFESRGVYEKDLEVDYDFGNWTYATKSGMKFEDMNANGVYDAGDKPLGGIRIYIEIDGVPGFTAGDLSDITDGTDGSYFIGDVPLGIHNVYEVIDGTDWIQSFPAEDYYEVDFTSSLEDTGNDFGNWQPASIEGYKFNDRAIDGSFDTTDSGLEGWRIFVDYNGDGILNIDSEFGPEPYDDTDADGYYEIGDVHPGTFMVREVDQTDWTQSRGDFEVKFESRGEYGSSEPGGEYDFGNWTTTGLHGFKFEDKNADGVKDFSEGAPDIEFTISLVGTDFLGNAVSETTTTVDGYYEFTDLVPGTYMVSEIVAEGWYQSYPEGNSYIVTLYSDVFDEMSYDFGNWTPADPHGYKVHDLDADGFDDGEPRLEGWQIHIEGETGWKESYAATTTTDEFGYWEFDEVPPGTYTITEVGQDGWTQSWPLNDGGYDMTLESGEIPEESFDFLNWTTATKFGMKFYDADGDGLPKEEGEIGLAGWTIYVDYNNNTTLDAGEPWAVTDENGSYMIDGILPGTWFVREVDEDSDWMNTYPLGGFYYEEFISQGVNEGNDFGNTTKVDKTFELTFEAEAPEDTTFTVTFTSLFVPPQVDQRPIDSIEVNALAVPAPEDHELDLVETEEGSGIYTAVFPVWPQTLITNVEWWAGYKGERIKLGDGAAEELIDAPFTNEFEYGARALGSKWNDTVYDVDGLPSDVVGDGIWDEDNEPGMAGWTIQLFRKNLSGGWDLYDVTVTGSGGAYAFADLLPGEYYVAEIIPLDPETGLPLWIQSAPAEGDEDFTAADGTVVRIDFGNYEEPFAPFTEPETPEKPVTPAKSEPFLPFTGGEALLLIAVILMAASAGVALRRHGRHAA